MVYYSKISLTFVTILAPSKIKLFVPKLCGLLILPGIAKTSLPCSKATFAVIIAPLFLPASTTKTPSDKPLIILFLFGKFSLFGFVPFGYSEIIQPPVFKIDFAKSLFWDGYNLSIPHPKTAIVFPMRVSFWIFFDKTCTLPRWAYVSIPKARPLMILKPFKDNFFEKSNATFLPYCVHLLVPTIAIPFWFKIHLFPNIYNFNGGSYIFLNFSGYSFELIEISSICSFYQPPFFIIKQGFFNIFLSLWSPIFNS